MDETKLPAAPDEQGQTQQSPPYGPQPQQNGPGQPQSVWVPPPPQAGQGTVPPPPYPPYGTGQQPQPYPYPPYGPQAPAPAPAPGAQPATSRRTIAIVAGAALAVILTSAALAIGGEPGKFITVGIEFAPLAILAALAYAGARSTVAAVFCYAWLAVVAFGVMLNTLGSVLLAEVKSYSAFRALLEDPTLTRSTPLGDIFQPDAGAALLWTVLLMTLASVLALAMLLRPVRVLISRIMPIDPDSFVHKIALCILTFVLISMFVPLIVLQGRPPLLEVVKNSSLQDLQQGSDLGVRPVDQIYQFVWTIPAALIAAGWPIARNFRGALLRLGMVRPTARQVLAGLAFGVVLAVFGGLLDQVIQTVWTALGWPITDASAFNKVLAQLITPAGAVLIGFTAGVGEEMVFRGLLQPRIGLIAANLVFTSLHASQYGLDGLVSVFIVGAILGIIRARSNTTTSAIVHGMYDFTLILAASLSLTGP